MPLPPLRPRCLIAQNRGMTLGDRGYSLELHRHGAAKPLDLTPHVIDVTDTHGRVQPYGGIDVTLDVPLRFRHCRASRPG